MKAARFIVWRIASAVTFLAALFAVLIAMSAADHTIYTSPAAVSEFEQKFSPDRPFFFRFIYQAGGLLKGDFGISLETASPISDLISDRYQLTVAIIILSCAVAVPFAFAFGLIALRNRRLRQIISVFSLLSRSAPAFVAGMVLIFVFAMHLRWLPALTTINSDDLWRAEHIAHLILPVITVAISIWGHLVFFLVREFIGVGSSKGHIARSAMRSTMIRMIGRALNLAVIPTFLTEVVFSAPGVGRLFVQGSTALDTPLVITIAIITAGALVTVNVVTGLVLYALNYEPRQDRMRSRIFFETHSQFWTWQKRHQTILRRASAILLFIVIALAAFASAIAPFDPMATAQMDGRAGSITLLGVDMFGRDVFSRTLYATRTSMILAALGVALPLLCALSVFSVRRMMHLHRHRLYIKIQGLWPSCLKEFTSYSICIWACFPPLAIAFIFCAVAAQAPFENVGIFGGLEVNVIFGIAAAQCSRLIGASDDIKRLVSASLMAFGSALVIGATLGFVGLSVVPPTLGGMSEAGSKLIASNTVGAFVPMFLIAALAFAFYMLGSTVTQTDEVEGAEKRITQILSQEPSCPPGDRDLNLQDVLVNRSFYRADPHIFGFTNFKQEISNLEYGLHLLRCELFRLRLMEQGLKEGWIENNKPNFVESVISKNAYLHTIHANLRRQIEYVRADVIVAAARVRKKVAKRK